VDARRTLLVSFFFALLGVSTFCADRPRLVCFGDSITAGYGLDQGESYPDALHRNLEKLGYSYQVDNKGTSGATTKDAVARVHSIVALRPAIVIVEFGGNDGLRGLPLDQTRRNLDSVLTTIESAHIRLLILRQSIERRLFR
jgi:acyl-CoA thioesterase-1